MGVSRFICNNPHITHNSDAVAKLLANHHIKFSETSVPDETEVTQCFGKDDETAEYLIDFLSHVLHFRETAPPDVVTGFMETVRELSIKRGDCLFLNTDCSIQIAKK